MNIPNCISLARLLVVPIVVWAIVEDRMAIAFWLFVFAGVSDAVDGFLARQLSCKSVLGEYLDPLADKALLMSIYLTLGSEGYLPNWLVILVVSRDVLILGGAMLYHTLTQKLQMRPIFISKINTLAQILLAGCALASYALEVEIDAVVTALVWIVAATTVASGTSYLILWTAKAGSIEERPS